MATILARQRIYEIGETVTPSNFIPLPHLLEHFELQPLGFACWETKPDSEVCAFYVFVPLTKKATDLINRVPAGG
jgi:hypothetical protein